MKKLLGIVVLGLLLTVLQSCSSTGVKDISQLSAPSSTEANVYFKRTGGFVLGGTRAIIKVDGTEYGSLNTHDFLKINVQPGNRILTVAGDPYGGVFGKTDVSISLQAGKSYYFVTSVRAGKGLGIFMGGAIGQAATGGPFTILQVTKSSFSGGNLVESESTTTTVSSTDKASQIKAIHELYKEGILTKEEFEKEKTKILNQWKNF